MKKIRVIICFFIGILSPFIIHGLTLGVLPFENQRSNTQQDWFGYYIQYRLESRLVQQTGLTIKSLPFLRLWEFNTRLYKNDPALNLNLPPFYLISGSYQKVFDSFYIQINLMDHLNKVVKSKEIEIKFKEIDSELDQVLVDICDPIIQNWNTENSGISFSPDMQPLFKLREYLYKPRGEISPDLFDTVYLVLDQYPAIAFKHNLIEGVLIFSRLNLRNTGTRYLGLAENWARKFLKETPKDSLLNAYLAEIFYLKDFTSPFVEKLSLSAIELDSNRSALPYLLLCLVKGITTAESEGYLKKLDEINPWIIPRDPSDSVQFQHGILTHFIIENFNQGQEFREDK